MLTFSVTDSDGNVAVQEIRERSVYSGTTGVAAVIFDDLMRELHELQDKADDDDPGPRVVIAVDCPHGLAAGDIVRIPGDELR